MTVRGIHHLGVAVADLDEALETYRRLFGATLEHRSTVADQERHRVDALVGHRRAVLDRRAEEPAVGCERLIEIRNGDPEVMDAADGHRADATSATCARGSRMRSTRPYSTASAGVMNRSRSMSSITCSNERPVCRDSTSAI